jgi:hypothetical protein
LELSCLCKLTRIIMLSNIPQSKWGSGTGRQVILKSDFSYIEEAVLELVELLRLPDLTWVDGTAIKVAATPDCKARVLLGGFPSPLHPGLLVDGGLSDGKYRENSSDVSMDFDTSSHFNGNEKSNQWYVIYAYAASTDTTFTLGATPLMRFSSQASQVITLRNNANTADIGYGFTTDSWRNSKILVLTGASRGLVRTITANNNDSGTGGTITYSGTALTMTQGDYFVTLPNTNFRYLGMILNNGSGNIQHFYQKGRSFRWTSPITLATGAINGWTAQALDLKAPITARLVHGLAHADYGNTLKCAVSYDATDYNKLLHIAYPGAGFKSTGAAAPFSFVPLADHTIYLDNENTAAQNYLVIGWDE